MVMLSCDEMSDAMKVVGRAESNCSTANQNGDLGRGEVRSVDRGTEN